jgi:hypothetical protein|tara:strand:- start:7192 stop:9768 length:2577 start_codon:yes stop_codon:yes gene_type:complete
MSYSSLLEKFTNDFVSIRKIEKGISSIPLHPLYKFSLGVAMNSIMHPRYNKLIIFVPVYSDLFNWLTFFITLEMMKLEYQEITNDFIAFEFGDKLLFNQCIVEFQSYDPQNNWFWLKTKDGSTSLPADRGHDLQPISSERPLTNLKTVVSVYNKQSIKVLDHIIDVSTGGNHEPFQNTLLYVNTLNEMTDFMNKYKIAGEKLSDIFLWGKLSSDGSVKQLATTRFTSAKASCVIAPKIYYIEDLLERKTHNIHAVLINNIDDCIDELQQIDLITDNNIPIVIGANPDNISNLELFTERGFQIWSWTKSLIKKTVNKDIVYKDEFKKIDKELKNYTNKKFSVITCSDPELQELVQKFFSLKNMLPIREIEKLAELYYRTSSLYLTLIRQVRDLDDKAKTDYSAQCNNLFDQIEDFKQWITKDNLEIINELRTDTLKYVNENSGNNKAKLLQDLTAPPNKSLKSYGFILGNNNDIIPHNIFWYNYLTGNKDTLRAETRFTSNFLTEAEYFSKKHIYFDKLIICGWLGKSKMDRLFADNKVTDVNILLYPIESGWYNDALKRWNKENDIKLQSEIWADILSTDKSEFEFSEEKYEDPEVVQDDNAIDIIDFEYQARKSIYRKYITSDMDESELARMVLFNHDYYSLITDSHKFTLVTDFFQDIEHPEPRIVSIDKISSGDYISHNSTDSDFLREYAEKALIDAGEKQAIDISQLWWKKLVEYMKENEFDSNKIYAHLVMKGFKRNIATLRNWINGNTIKPDNIGDIKIIADTIQSSDLSDKINDIEKAARVVLSARHQASMYLHRMMQSKLPTILEKQSFDSDLMTFELEGFGEIIVLRVEEIDTEKARVSRFEVNRLMKD